jgi:non-homologous end joining protein Ku
MLTVISGILYEYPRWTKPVVLLKEPYDWEDGKYEDYHNDQPMMLPVEGKKEVLLVKPCACYHGATKLEVTEMVEDLDKAARKSCDQRSEPKPKRQWICTVENYADSRSLKKGEYVRLRKGEVVGIVLDLCKNIDTRSFLEGFSDVEDQYFDGDVGIGYRMQWRPSGAADVLDVSMVHAYYGK